MVTVCGTVAATNIPWEIDEAVLRRLAKRIYVPLPDIDSRTALVTHLLNKHSSGSGGKMKRMDQAQLQRIVLMTEGYSGSDLSAVSVSFWLVTNLDTQHTGVP